VAAGSDPAEQPQPPAAVSSALQHVPLAAGSQQCSWVLGEQQLAAGSVVGEFGIAGSIDR
jgi:hypothetical protein